MAKMAFHPAPPRESEYLYIDGGCLRAAVRKISKDVFGDENAYQALVPSVVAGGGYKKIFYYDAVPGKAHGESQAAYEVRVQPDHERFERIQALDSVHVALGQIVGADRRQKGVDVRLAVDMMTHAFRGNISKATLLAGDADFIPLIKALVSEGIHVTLWHPAQANAELKGAADSTRLFDFKSCYYCFTANGHTAAFHVSGTASGGNIHPATNGLTDIVSIGDQDFAGKWQDNLLRLWRSPTSTNNWSYMDVAASGGDLKQALIALDAVYGWDLAATGEQWISTQ